MAKPTKMTKKADDARDKKLGIKENTPRDTKIDKAVGLAIIVPGKRPIKLKK